MTTHHTNKQELQKGDTVTISGLQAATGYNGKLGTIVSVPTTKRTTSSNEEESRYGVRIMDGSEDPKEISIKRSNLLLQHCDNDNECDPDPSSQEKSSIVFQIGDQVILTGLKTAKLNGKAAVVIAEADPSNEGRYGVRLSGASKESFRVRPMNMQKKMAKNLKTKSTKELKKKRDEMQKLITPAPKECASADQMALMRSMMKMFMTEEHEIKMFGRKIEPMPDFRMELIQECGFPPGVDAKWANQYLRLDYEQSSVLPHMDEMCFKQPNYEPTNQDILKRLRTNDRDKLYWYLSAPKPGSIYKNHRAYPYNSYVRHDFSNQAYRKEILYQGKTHVAVGFVDLGMLMVADLKPGSEPLHFVGVEQSAFSIAKTHVIWEMMSQSPNVMSPQFDQHLMSILQVWFSTTWTAETERRAKEALSSLCLNCQSNLYHPDVRGLLQHWLHASTIPLSKARKEYSSLITEAYCSAGHMKLKHDRIAVAKYAITGDFAVGDDPVCGNILTFDCPDGTPPSALDQSIFSALNFKNIMMLATSDQSMTIMEAAEEYALFELRKLAMWCQTGKVVLELICSPFEDIVEEIACMCPWTMSWSNLVDYVDYESFHKMARYCSKHGDTIHFAYSMNWTSIIWGTCLIDYMGEEMMDTRREMIDRMNTHLEKMFSILEWKRRFRLPLPQNPINTASYGLEVKYHKEWTNFFFDKARQYGPCNVGNIEHAMVSPLSSTGHSTVAFTWTYDPEINFNGLPVV